MDWFRYNDMGESTDRCRRGEKIDVPVDSFYNNVWAILQFISKSSGLYNDIVVNVSSWYRCKRCAWVSIELEDSLIDHH